MSDGNSRHLPLMLKLRAKSTTQSHRAPVYYVDLCLRDGISLEEAVTQAKLTAKAQEEAGIDLVALEQAARTALGNGSFEDSEEEIPAIAEEFYPETTAGQEGGEAGETTGDQACSDKPSTPSNLSRKLGAKAKQSLGPQ